MSMLEKSLANCGTTLLSSLNISLEESFLLCCVSIFVAYSALRRVVLDLEVGIIDKSTMRCLFKNQRSQSMPNAFKFRPFSPKRKADVTIYKYQRTICRNL